MRIDCMLSSVLHVLAIIGIVLLCIIGFLLLLILAVLLAPLRYRLFVEKEDGWKKENIHIRADVGWLAGFIRVKLRLFDPQVLKVKVLFFTVFDLFKEKKEKKEKRRAEKEPVKKKTATEETNRKKEAPQKQTENTAEESISQTENKAESPSDDVEEQSQPREQETKEKKKSFSLKEKLEKIRYTIPAIYDKIKPVAGKLLRHILPQKIKGYLLFGTGQPDQTGYILGVISIIRGIRGYDKFDIEADFERQIVEGKIQCKGRIRLATVGILALQIYGNKELRELINKWKQEEN